jgi:hypothetical protein
MIKVGLSWTCFCLGDVASRIMNFNGNSIKWAAFWYPVYHNLMSWSSDLQGTSSKGPWDTPTK